MTLKFICLRPSSVECLMSVLCETRYDFYNKTADEWGWGVLGRGINIEYDGLSCNLRLIARVII